MKRELKDDKRIKNNSYIDAWNNALYGIIYTTKTQTNFRVQLIISILVAILSLFLNLEKSEFLCLVLSVVLVLFAELVNTAIESVVDLLIDVYHPKAKIAKDVAAGAVVITALNAIVVAYFLFFEKISESSVRVLSALTSSPNHLAFVSFVLTIIGVVALKILFNKGTPLQGGMPSGHAAISFATLTAIWLNTNDIIVFTLALVSSILVIESRVEAKIHTLAEVLFGAFFGALITLLVYSITMIA